MATTLNRVVKGTSRFFTRARIQNITEIPNRGHADLSGLAADDHLQYVRALGATGTQFSYNNSIAETVVGSLVLPADVPAVDHGLLLLAIMFASNQTAAAVTYTWRARLTGLGGAIFWSSPAISIAAATLRDVVLFWHLHRTGAALTQSQVRLLTQATTEALGAAADLEWGAMAEPSNILGATLALTCQMGTASATATAGLRAYGASQLR